MPPRTAEHITVDCLTLSDLQGAINSFKITCRPARRGRPTRCGRRTFTFKGMTIVCWIGESCLGAGGWGMTCRLQLAGKRTTLRQIAKASREA
jgi:hypothetical protein